jgi:hypothetical protein
VRQWKNYKTQPPMEQCDTKARLQSESAVGKENVSVAVSEKDQPDLLDRTFPG